MKNLNFPHGDLDKVNCFIYADPPYIETYDTFKYSFTEQDTKDFFDCLIESKCKFAMIEFDNDFILTKQKNEV